MEKMLAFVMLSGFIIFVNGDAWGYPDLENEEDFPDWGGMCDIGKRQSPIDLSFNRAFKGIFKEYTFRHYIQHLLGPRIENNGHTLKLKFTSPKLSVIGGGLKGEYFLEEIHFHWASEHTIEGRRYPLEMHMVHRNGRYSNVLEALSHSDGFAVFAVLFHVSSNDNEDIAKILQNVNDIAKNKSIGKYSNITEKIVLQNLLPRNPSNNYFFYKGSLTTPKCAESVIWTVYSETKPISLFQIELFASIETDNGLKVKNNYRDIQKLRNRPVTYISKWDPDINSGSISLKISIASFVLILNAVLREIILY